MEPNIFVLIENFSELQNDIYTKLIELERKKQRSDIQKKEINIGILMIYQDVGELSPLEFI